MLRLHGEEMRLQLPPGTAAEEGQLLGADGHLPGAPGGQGAGAGCRGQEGCPGALQDGGQAPAVLQPLAADVPLQAVAGGGAQEGGALLGELQPWPPPSARGRQVGGAGDQPGRGLRVGHRAPPRGLQVLALHVLWAARRDLAQDGQSRAPRPMAPGPRGRALGEGLRAARRW
ncbi:chemokine-like receptor 1 [Platysternon megacephalum]|uniref:Chemokine-like receptor 1 n=1 Tax=Platysternon megacephalum TaxID=55544 RepID=A0A4D9DP91_9SAUR|nr:chemokine-like receptor 1 [Platysternon megacephalum]